jgi:hypothetical protein
MRHHDVYSQPDAADPVLDERTVLGLARRHGVSGVAVTRMNETGGEAHVYGIDDHLVVKVQRPHRLRPRTNLEIDFGDAYIGHPALDWRWPTHEDHLALLQGYDDDAPLTDEFMAAWRSGLALSEMTALATRPDRRPQALERLHDLLKTFT